MEMKTVSFTILVITVYLFLYNSSRTQTLHKDPSIFLDSQRISDSHQILFKHNNILTEQNLQRDNLPGKKSPWLAGILSTFIPGSGQIYNGQWIKASIQWALLAGSIYLMIYDVNFDDDSGEIPPATWVGISTGAATWLWSVLDAVFSANKINDERKKKSRTHLINFKIKNLNAGIDVSFENSGMKSMLSLDF